MASSATGSVVVTGELAFLRLDVSGKSEDDAAGAKTLRDRLEKPATRGATMDASIGKVVTRLDLLPLCASLATSVPRPTDYPTTYIPQARKSHGRC